MQHDFPTDSARIRSHAEFLQRLALTAPSTPLREELEEMSLKSMEEAAALEKDIAIQLMPNELAPADTGSKRGADCSKK